MSRPGATAVPSDTPFAVPAVPATSTLTPTASTTTQVPYVTPMKGASPTAATVSVTAVKGNVFIRRGPDVAFNPTSVLREGQTAVAVGRDVLTKWLEIRSPEEPAESGWISIVTQFTSVTGDSRSLPVIEPGDWPIPAFLRNCTHHELIAYPGGVLIPPVDAFPDNDVQINPGSYKVIDTDVDGYPEVLSVDLREGSAVDIRIDGNGEKKKCPPP